MRTGIFISITRSDRKRFKAVAAQGKDREQQLRARIATHELTMPIA